MVCSVDECIHIWDVNALKRVNIFHSWQIDSNGVKGTCFGVTPDQKHIIFGTDSSKLQVFDLLTSAFIRAYSVNRFQDVDHTSTYISDIKIIGETLIALDAYGSLTQWSVEGSELKFQKSIVPPIRPYFNQLTVNKSFSDKHYEFSTRNFTRLLDFNDDLIVSCTHRGWICILSRKNPRTVTYERSMTRVECLKLKGTVIYCGLEAGVIQQITLREDPHSGFYVNACPKSCKLTKQFTEFSDTITSIDVTDDGKVVVAGDINGEIHGYLTSSSIFGRAQRARVFRLPNAHGHGSYVWSLQLDASRIFSGDSDGKLVVHDLWTLAQTRKQGSEVLSTSPIKNFKRLKCM